MKSLVGCSLLLFLFVLPAAAGTSPAAEEVQVALLQSSADSADRWNTLNPKRLKLRSRAALILDHDGHVIYGKAVDEPRPIASITKLMTAMVILDAGLPMQEKLKITKQDRDLLRLTGSRLKYGATLTREKLLRLALMASENRAAAALARTFPGGRGAFVAAMNRKARELGMTHSRFADPTGLDAGNMASPRDLARMVRAALNYPLIREATTTRTTEVRPYRKRGPLRFGNTNRLLRNKAWQIELSKTGYINEAGRCLVMQARIAGEPMTIVLLDSFGKLTPFGDSNRIRKWIEKGLKG
ncbi:MAG TPA: D-alanyl-D-alanine endopeptidase [Sedimenticola thiotaurini]|uniref:D-alanyl-D-alanine endopeptidase n=1 Tax=Sedimenticola thiotaurini TaxID=1543721 RepID=A0A831RR87_9GAMM|nr:D-alanyl-D-alanine endopeptidase [Sedimenticola thiotaurini]